MYATQTARIIGPQDGKAGTLGGIGVRFMIDGAQSGGGFSLVEHPMPPRALGAPLHRHTHEDEYSYVLEGRVGAQLGDETVYGEPGDLIVKPRGQWHAFWNAGDEPARILEIISRAGSRATSSSSSTCFATVARLIRPPSRRSRPSMSSSSTWRASLGSWSSTDCGRDGPRPAAAAVCGGLTSEWLDMTAL